MTIFQIDDRVTPKATDSKLGKLHGTVFIVVYINSFNDIIKVKSETGEFLSVSVSGSFRYGPRSESYYSSRFELIESQKLKTIEERIKKLYRKCKTTSHWG